MFNDIPPVREFARDSTMTMVSRRDGDTVTITYRGNTGSRREASVWARQYAKDAGSGMRAAFSFSFIGDGGHASYVYRLQHRDARLRAQLGESIHNR